MPTKRPHSLWSDLTDPDASTREKAAATLLETQDPAPEQAGQWLREGLKEAPGAAAILLLGRIPGEQNVQFLEHLSAQYAGKVVKTHPWSPAVPVKTACVMALSRLGDTRARHQFNDLAQSGDLDSHRFVLENLRDVDDPKTLHILKATLDDVREVPEGVPSGAGPRRRLADTAVDAFVHRLNLKPSFTLRPSGRYTDEQLHETRRLIDSVLPQ